MRKAIKTHLSVNIQGLLNLYRRKSMTGIMEDEDGRKLTDKEVRAELQQHLELGHTVLPICNEKECPDFNYFGGGCPGHDVRYYDDNDNEITEAEYKEK